MKKTRFRSPITTHILDLAKGRPAKDIAVELFFKKTSKWVLVAEAVTNRDGRVENLLPLDFDLKRGEYCLDFHVKSYYGKATFYPQIRIAFRVEKTNEHYHIPLLLNRYGYSTYRGS